KHIENIVFSPNMEYMVTSNDVSVVLWTVDLLDNKIEKENTFKDHLEPERSLLRLSNKKLLISGFKDSTGYSELTVLDMETAAETPKCTTIKPSNGRFLQFLPNGNLLLIKAPYIYVFTETILNNSPYTRYTSKYHLCMVDIRKGLEVVDIRMDLKMDDGQRKIEIDDTPTIIQMDLINDQIFFTLKGSL
ncbi:5407_t:CDS:2, partial [Funneliformis mosseae]